MSVGKVAQRNEQYTQVCVNAPSDVLAPGEFAQLPHVNHLSIIDWEARNSPKSDAIAYPEWAPRPEGPFTFASIDERDTFLTNRKSANKAQAAMRRNDARITNNHHIHHIHPIWLGGSPDDPENMIILTREQHIEIERFWSTMRADLRRQWHKGGK